MLRSIEALLMIIPMWACCVKAVLDMSCCARHASSHTSPDPASRQWQFHIPLLAVPVA